MNTRYSHKDMLEYIDWYIESEQKMGSLMYELFK